MSPAPASAGQPMELPMISTWILPEFLGMCKMNYGDKTLPLLRFLEFPGNFQMWQK
jgi:hypothetical protein